MNRLNARRAGLLGLFLLAIGMGCVACDRVLTDSAVASNADGKSQQTAWRFWLPPPRG
ncbi:MAG: hypothetical protein CHACPFDD_02652 [Phycisphaerae bacterium]|nr:hypothetical protein [Phycisphaerae bacterium]